MENSVKSPIVDYSVNNNFNKLKLDDKVKYIIGLWEEYVEIDDEHHSLSYEICNYDIGDERFEEIEDLQYDLSKKMSDIKSELHQIIV